MFTGAALAIYTSIEIVFTNQPTDLPAAGLTYVLYTFIHAANRGKNLPYCILMQYPTTV